MLEDFNASASGSLASTATSGVEAANLRSASSSTVEKSPVSAGGSSSTLMESATGAIIGLDAIGVVDRLEKQLPQDLKGDEVQADAGIVAATTQGAAVVDGIAVLATRFATGRVSGGLTGAILPLAAVSVGADMVAGIESKDPERVAGSGGGLIGGIWGGIVVGAAAGAVTGPGAIVLSLVGGIAGGLLGEKAAKEYLTGTIGDLMGVESKAPVAADPLSGAQLATPQFEEQPLLAPVKAPVAVVRADLVAPDFLSARSANGGSPATLKSLQSAVATSPIIAAETAPVIDRKIARASAAQLRRFQAQENGPGKRGFHAETLTLGDEKIMISEGGTKGDALIHIGISDKDGGYHELRTVKRGAEETKVMKQMQASLTQGTFSVPTA